MYRSLAALCALTLAAIAPLAARAQAPARPPVAAYARLPAIQTAAMAPDGSKLAYIGGTADDRVIFITPIDGGGEPLTIRPGAVNIKDLRWADSRYLLLGFDIFDNRTNFASGLKTAYTYHRDLIIDSATGKVTGQVLQETNFGGLALDLPVRAVVGGAKPYAIVQGLELSADALLTDNTRYIPKKGDDIVPALWRVDLASGKGRMVERGNRLTWAYATDLTGEGRLRWDYDDVTQTVNLLGRRKGAMSWKALSSWPIDDPKFDVLGYSDPDDAVIIRTNSKTGARLVKRSLVDGTETEIVLAQPSLYANILWDAERLAPAAVITGEERPAYQWLDAELGAIHARLSKALGGKQVHLVDWSADRGRFIIMAEAPDSAPAWFLYDTRTRQASSIGESYPELAGVPLFKSRWIRYPAADGLSVPAYLTLPAARADGGKPPLVVLVHGGPASRDDYGFDWLVQFLASRGYAVLQPQFRGSGGFGDAFERAGYGEWGGKMQTDIIDGLAATAAHGVDFSRACIMGLSYGGYAALNGAVFNHKTYRCAIAVNADSDLPLSIGQTRRAFGEESSSLAYWRTSIGDPRNIGSALAAASPARRMGGVASPILLLHSEKDTIVPIEQGRAMERAMKDAGQTGGLILLEGDDHHLSMSKSRQRLLTESEAFLAKYLPVAP